MTIERGALMFMWLWPVLWLMIVGLVAGLIGYLFGRADGIRETEEHWNESLERAEERHREVAS